MASCKTTKYLNSLRFFKSREVKRIEDVLVGFKMLPNSHDYIDQTFCAFMLQVRKLKKKRVHGQLVVQMTMGVVFLRFKNSTNT